MAEAQKKKKSLSARERFLKKYENIQLERDLQKVEKRIPDFWERLEEIKKHYNNSIEGYKATLRTVIEMISQEDMDDPVIHSIRYRAKDPDSLLVKLIQKSAEVPEEPQGSPEIEKYRNLTKDNYYKIITDLIGVRILIRYRHQWKNVHELVWKLFYKSDVEYISDWEESYQPDPAARYIVEQPKAYIKQSSDRAIYEEFGKNIFCIKDSQNHYASVHYIINVAGRYCEIQVRTIFDEAWCECNHDCVYKTRVKGAKEKNTLECLSVILSQHTTAAESIVTLMCELNEKKPKSTVKTPSTDVQECDVKKNAQVFSVIQERAEKLSQPDAKGQFLLK